MPFLAAAGPALALVVAIDLVAFAVLQQRCRRAGAIRRQRRAG